ncbi:MAG: ATP-binding protein [Ignavibacteriales bacterium]|nr:ATP-binding protein [Ignavibacteriales bacterium]
MSINWNNIRTIGPSKNEGFEEFVCQLARKETAPDSSIFIRKGKPDAGVECFRILENGDEWAWQAKYFTASLEKAQWQQLDHSVNRAIKAHPNLKKYTIAIPIDPPDARNAKQISMLERWDVHVRKWTSLVSKKGKTIEIVPWWSSDLIEKLQKPENVGLTYFWFNKEEFTDSWFIEQNELAIADLGARYTQKLNVELEISKVFSGLSRDEIFRNRFNQLIGKLFLIGNNLRCEEKLIENLLRKFKDVLSKITILYNRINLVGIEPIPVYKLICFLNQLNDVIDSISDILLEEEDKLIMPNEYHFNKKYGSQITLIRKFNNSIGELREFLQSAVVELADRPFLLLTGEAGVGKSHLIADIVKRRNVANLRSLFLLGQHFVSDENPWSQIFLGLQLKCSLDEFLGALDSKAQISGNRIVFFIDAINEGRGKFFWGKYINSFIEKIKKYQWLGLVLSVRSTYVDVIWSKTELIDEFLICYNHTGFKDIEFEASNEFFNYYNIQLPNVPLLHPEFQNPLFLKLFCEGLRNGGFTKIPDGMQGITTIFDFYTSSLNKILSSPDRLNYSKNFNIIGKVLEALVAYKTKNKISYVPLEDALNIVNQLSAEVGIPHGVLLDELQSEGILTENRYRLPSHNYEYGLNLAYERFEDHIAANLIITKYPDLENSFKENGDLFYIVDSVGACYSNKGLMEALSIQLPEKIGKEFYEITPHLKNEYPIIECFVQSLLWRKNETISPKLLDFINNFVFSFNGTLDLFWGTVLSVSAMPGHYFNANFLHKQLFPLSLANRDAWWTIFLKKMYYNKSIIERFISWIWTIENRSYISDESVKLTSITLAWFHTSTNRKLRDSATKALVCLLEDRIAVLISLLKDFEGISDPYVYERLFAVAYGCALRTSQKEKLLGLSTYIFETIFNTNAEVYPHILLRDYARGVIEYTAFLGYKLEFDIEKARPPYSSSFPTYIHSDKYIKKKYGVDSDSENFKDYHWGQDYILTSMVTEQTKKIYGDFGRYVFQRALGCWELNCNTLSNLAIDLIFEKYGYDKEKHGGFDRELRSGRENISSPNERIGKKYQWLAFHEILARVSDNFAIKTEFSKDTGTDIKYEGTWDPYVRDIDPSITMKNIVSTNERGSTHFSWAIENHGNWELNNKDWLKTTSDLPDIVKLLTVSDNMNSDWLVLSGYTEWNEPTKLGYEKWDLPQKEMIYSIRSYLAPEDEFKTIENRFLTQDFLYAQLPQETNWYEVFSREYYWAPAYNYFNHDYFGSPERVQIFDEQTNESILDVMITSKVYYWEKGIDHSKEEAISIIRPSRNIYENMSLQFSKNEGELTDVDGNLICFDPSVSNKTKPSLLIKKQPFWEFLKKNHLRIFWRISGEKRVSGGYKTKKDFLGRLEIRGKYLLNEAGQLEGQITTRNT